MQLIRLLHKAYESCRLDCNESILSTAQLLSAAALVFVEFGTDVANLALNDIRDELRQESLLQMAPFLYPEIRPWPFLCFASCAIGKLSLHAGGRVAGVEQLLNAPSDLSLSGLRTHFFSAADAGCDGDGTLTEFDDVELTDLEFNPQGKFESNIADYADSPSPLRRAASLGEHLFLTGMDQVVCEAAAALAARNSVGLPLPASLLQARTMHPAMTRAFSNVTTRSLGLFQAASAKMVRPASWAETSSGPFGQSLPASLGRAANGVCAVPAIQTQISLLDQLAYSASQRSVGQAAPIRRAFSSLEEDSPTLVAETKMTRASSWTEGNLTEGSSWTKGNLAQTILEEDNLLKKGEHHAL